MVKEWSDEQLLAINTRDRSLLVSAAAGSGKTATLTERIIRSILEDEDMSVNELLVVTYTVTAAQELRERITDALKEAIKQNPDNVGLEKQLLMLSGAKIKTIDSFCNEVVKENADIIGISPVYRIAEAAEIRLIANNILDGLLNAIWEGQARDIATTEELAGLMDCLTNSGKKEDVKDTVFYLYQRAQSAVDGVVSIRKMAEEYNPSKYTAAENTRFGSYLMSITKEAAKHYRKLWKQYLGTCYTLGKSGEKFQSMFLSDIEWLDAIIEKNTYAEMKTVLENTVLCTKPKVNKDDETTLAKDIKYIRDAMKVELKDNICKKYFFYTEEEWKEHYVNIYPHFDSLCRIIEEFDKQFIRDKRFHSVYEHSDIARFTHSVLVREEVKDERPVKQPTEAAINIRNRFRAIYIDEYQDVNELQNDIFSVISKDSNRFMVGDIKQSIYTFRGARPDIFASMKQSFPILGSDGDFPKACVNMSNNYRCDKGIVDFVNSVFDPIFPLLGDSMGYRDSDRLNFAKKYDTPPAFQHKPAVCMIPKKASKDEDYEDEPHLVARAIRRLLDQGVLNNGKPLKYSDIAILMKKTKNYDSLYRDALSELGIPSVTAKEKNFFMNSEVLLTLCLLNSIDNPRRDIYLAGLLRSPLYDFSADELFEMRQLGADCLYGGVKLSAEGGNEKAKRFVHELTSYRLLAEGTRADLLLSRLYRETGLFALASKNGGKDNLTLLYDCAKRFEGGAYRGLYSFINYVNSILESGNEPGEKKEIADVNAVKIITVHGSKGLEYPVVFMVNTGKSLSSVETSPKLVFADGFGANFKVRTPSGLSLVENPIFNLISNYNLSTEFEENLRVMYVALTRARERLFVVGVCPTVKSDAYLEQIGTERRRLDGYSLKNLDSPLEIVLVGSGAETVTPEELVSFSDGEKESWSQKTKTDKKDGTVGTAEEVKTDDGVDRTDEYEEISDDEIDGEELSRIFVERFSYKYPREFFTTLPAKLSVSSLSPTVLDGVKDYAASVLEVSSRDRDAVSDNNGTERVKRLPDFYTGKEHDESARAGTATHIFMQFFNLDSLEKNGAEAEAERLFSEKFISEEDKKRVRLPEIEKFKRSELFTAMKNAKKLYRELRFNVLLDAKTFTKESDRATAFSGEKILVQGVIDCIIIDAEGKIRLVDYKTDRFTDEELESSDKAEKAVRRKHSRQLYYYSLAIREMFGKEPDEKEIYSLHLGRSVKL